MSSWIQQFFIDQSRIAVIPASRLSVIQQVLENLIAALKGDRPVHDAACHAVNVGHEVDRLFFVLMKVNNSSISTVSTWSGKGALGSRCACALTQLATLCGLTPSSRPIRRKLLPSTYIRTARSRTSSLYP